MENSKDEDSIEISNDYNEGLKKESDLIKESYFKLEKSTVESKEDPTFLWKNTAITSIESLNHDEQDQAKDPSYPKESNKQEGRNSTIQLFVAYADECFELGIGKIEN